MDNRINFNWYFIANFDDSYINELPNNVETVDIPHTVKLLPYNYFSEEDYQGIYTYFKYFDLEKNNGENIYILRFNAFMVKAKIYLNTYYLGEFISLYNPVEIDITQYVKEKNNYLVVKLDTQEDKNTPPFGFVVDYLTFGGIYRKVELIKHPKIYIKKSLIHASSSGEITITNLVENNQKPYEIVHQIFDKDKLIKETNSTNFKLDNIILYTLENPYLYTLKTIIKSEYGEDTYTTKFGFRDVEFKLNGFYLNNKKIKLIGLNRHQAYPYIGYAASKSLQEDDANILKNEAKVNVVRTSHYPQSEDFLNKCDELGLLVISEIPGWQFISKEEKWRNQHYKNIESMILEEYNHPSLIAYGIRVDESIDDHELYQKSNEIAHKLDPFRQTLGVRNFKNSELLEDIYAYNDFNFNLINKGLDDPKSIKSTKNKPYLVTEYLGHVYPTKSFDSIEKRKEHALRHASIINDTYSNDKITGAIGWCAFDYNTHKEFGSGDHICYHGVFDIFRNRKYASYIYSSQSDDEPILKVLCSFEKGDYSVCNYGSIYVATNLDYIKLYKNNEYINMFFPSKKEFSKMKHPLILIDDLIGNTFNEPKYNQKDKNKVAKILSKIAFYGLSSLKLKDKLTIIKIAMKCHLNYDNFVDYFNKYVSNWGSTSNVYKIEGYKDNKLLKTEIYESNTKTKLVATTTKNTLINEGTYDTIRISIQHIDSNNHVLDYSFIPIQIELEGDIELLGPSICSLIGGSTSIFIRSKRNITNNKAKVLIKSSINDIDIDIEVK